MTLRQLLFFDGPPPRRPRAPLPREIDGIAVEEDA
jgi:hypothetical protein